GRRRVDRRDRGRDRAGDPRVAHIAAPRDPGTAPRRRGVAPSFRERVRGRRGHPTSRRRPYAGGTGSEDLDSPGRGRRVVPPPTFRHTPAAHRGVITKGCSLTLEIVDLRGAPRRPRLTPRLIALDPKVIESVRVIVARV